MNLDDIADDRTPVDAGVALGQLPGHLRELCAALDRVAPLYRETPRSERAWFLGHLLEIATQVRDGFGQYVEAVTEQYEIEMVFRPRKDDDDT